MQTISVLAPLPDRVVGCLQENPGLTRRKLLAILKPQFPSRLDRVLWELRQRGVIEGIRAKGKKGRPLQWFVK